MEEMCCPNKDCHDYDPLTTDNCIKCYTLDQLIPTSDPPKIMCDDHRDEKLEVFEKTPGVFTVQLCECCVSEEKHAGFVDAEMEYKVGAYEEESTDEPPTEPGWYWYKGTKHFSDWNIIEFQNINNELLSIPSHLPIKYFEGQWSGPIEEPT